VGAGNLAMREIGLSLSRFPNADLVLASCSTGKGADACASAGTPDKNAATGLAKYLQNGTVTAFGSVLFSGRIGSLQVDENGKAYYFVIGARKY